MISNLQVTNYKSLADFTLDLHKLNVLIGPNNSGKSNILDCLAFLSDITGMSIRRAFERRGNFNHVLFAGRPSSEIAIKVSLTNIPHRGKTEYEVVVDNHGVIEEKLVTEIPAYAQKTVLIDGKEGSGKFYDESAKKLKTYSYGRENTALLHMRDLKRNRTVIKVREDIEKWRFYSFDPHEMRRADPARKSFDPGYRGEKANVTMHSLVSEYLESFENVQETLTSAIKEIEKLRSPLTGDGKTYIATKEKHFEEIFDYHQLSDGTLRFLAYLLVLSAPKSEIPSLVCFEEPENFVHPRLLQLLVQVLEKAKPQVIVTTHSPYFVDFVNPEDLVIIEKVEGKTAQKRPSKRELEKFLKDFSLGELWYSGKLGGVP